MNFLSRRYLLSTAILIAASIPALAGPFQYHTTYSYTPNIGSNAIGGIVKFEESATGGGSSWPDSLSGCLPSSFSCGTETLYQVFGSDTPRTQALLMGLAYNGVFNRFYDMTQLQDQINELGEQTTGPAHVVLFVDSSRAPYMLNRPWEALFPGVNEADIAELIRKVAIVGVPGGIDEDTFNSYVDQLSSFAQNLKMLDPGTGQLVNFWIPLSENQSVPPTEMTAIMFSDGTAIGSGTAGQDAVASSVPEPSSFALAGGAIFAAVLRFRRR